MRSSYRLLGRGGPDRCTCARSPSTSDDHPRDMLDPGRHRSGDYHQFLYNSSYHYYNTAHDSINLECCYTRTVRPPRDLSLRRPCIEAALLRRSATCASRSNIGVVRSSLASKTSTFHLRLGWAPPVSQAADSVMILNKPWFVPSEDPRNLHEPTRWTSPCFLKNSTTSLSWYTRAHLSWVVLLKWGNFHCYLP